MRGVRFIRGHMTFKLAFCLADDNHHKPLIHFNVTTFKSTFESTFKSTFVPWHSKLTCGERFVSMKSFLTRRYFNKGRELLPNKQSLLAQQQKKMDFRLGIKTKVPLWPLIKNRHYIFFITLTKNMQGIWLKLGFKWDTGNPVLYFFNNKFTV